VAFLHCATVGSDMELSELFEAFLRLCR